ncbi:MAG: DUF4625 domain-containing protein [Ichthyobacteriaceae bacterium]|nr:DUF4625 domain-containing protein [Ichthyobacteriaceae bacterium]
MNKILSILIFSTTLYSCTKDVKTDNEPPKIVDVKINNKTSNLALNTGDNINFKAQFTDNIELGSYNINMHYAGDNHNHNSLSNINIDKSGWFVSKSGNAKGTSHEVNFSEKIIESAKSGTYHCMVYLTDNSGNYTDYKEIDFTVTTTGLPQYNIIEPDFSTFEIDRGRPFYLKINLRAERGISKFDCNITSEETGVEIYKFEKNYDGSKDATINEEIEIPLTEVSGQYNFTLFFSDKEGNIEQDLETFTVN